MISFFTHFFERLFQNKNNEDLHALFEQYAWKIAECAQELDHLFTESSGNRTVCLQRIVRYKQEGDGFKKQINEILDHSFIINWIDKSDATQLANEFDSCLRAMRRVAKHTQIYKIDSVRSQVPSLTSCIVNMAQEIPLMIQDLKSSQFDRITTRNPEIGNLETEADEVCSVAISALWQDEGLNALTVIKWERIFQGLERITDHERNIADTMLSIARSSQ